MNFGDPLAAARGILLGLIIAVVFFWAPLIITIVWLLT